MVFLPILVASLIAVPQAPGSAPDDAARAAVLSALAEYNARREKTPETAEAHWRLGLWCEQKGLGAEAKSEFASVTRLDPGRESAWKKLGFERVDGRWTTPAQRAAVREEAEARRKADARWTPLLRKWRESLGKKARRAEAEASLAAVTDPRAVPAIWLVFINGGPEDQERAVDILGHIEDERSSRALGALAIFGRTEVVRRAAVETIIRRKADSVLIAWIGLLRAPVKYEVRQVAGPGSPGVLMVEGEQYNVRRFYSPPSLSGTESLFLSPKYEPMGTFTLPLQFNSTTPGPPLGSKYVGARADGTKLFVYDYTWAPPPPKVASRNSPDPNAPYQQYETMVLQGKLNSEFAMTETGRMAAGAQAQLQADVNAVEGANAAIRETNAVLVAALRRVSGQDHGEDREAWLKWYMERRGYSYVPPKDRPRSTVDVQVALPYTPTNRPPVLTTGGGGGSAPGYCMIWDHEKGKKPKIEPCFAAGTPVATPDGPRPIEALRRGDAVLARAVAGGPTFPVPIASAHATPAGRTLRLGLGGETLDATAGHPLWKVGTGWSRAGDLRPGDLLMTRDGPARLESVAEAVGQFTVYNLRLDGADTYLVGRLGLLSHDLGPIPDR